MRILSVLVLAIIGVAGARQQPLKMPLKKALFVRGGMVDATTAGECWATKSINATR